MYTLLFDTSLQQNYVALCENKRIVTLKTANAAHASVWLIPTIKQVLDLHHISSTSLDFIGVGNGPGSFTGSRICVLAAKTLNYLFKTPLLPYYSLEAYESFQLPLACDAKAKKIYLFEGDSLSLTSLSVIEGMKKFACPFEDPLLNRFENAIEAPLNLSPLIEKLYKKWEASSTLSHEELQPIYLRTP